MREIQSPRYLACVFISDMLHRSHVYLSADLSHSNNFVQHVMDELIEDYKGKFAAMGRTLKHVHVWSDGCASQFKNKNQFHWLTTGPFKHQVRLTHHFFQSCHGKVSLFS